jgi:hypothetical protein
MSEALSHSTMISENLAMTVLVCLHRDRSSNIWCVIFKAIGDISRVKAKVRLPFLIFKTT